MATGLGRGSPTLRCRPESIGQFDRADAQNSAAGTVRGDGAQGRDRTTDTVIFSHVLYQLSYLGLPFRPVGRSQRSVP